MNALDPRGRQAPAAIDFASLARRAVVAIAAAAGLFGLLSEQNVLTVAWRTGAVAGLGLCAILAFERFAPRFRGSSTRNARGGAR